MMFLSLLLQICTANFIISYDLDETIQISSFTNCSNEFAIHYNKYQATYSTDLMSINVNHIENNGLKAIINLNNSIDRYTFEFLDNGDNEMYIYNMFKYLTIYKNEIQIGTTYVINNNISILSPNISYIINQNTAAHCPLPHTFSYYCLVLDDTVIPQNIMMAGIAVSLPLNYPIHNNLLVKILTPISIVLFFCLLFFGMYIKSVRDERLQQQLQMQLLDNSTSTIVSEPESDNNTTEIELKETDQTNIN